MLRNPVAATHCSDGASPRITNRRARAFACCLCLAAFALPDFGLAQALYQGTIPSNLSANPSLAPPPIAITGNGNAVGSCGACVSILAPPVIVIPNNGEYDLTADGSNSGLVTGLSLGSPGILDEEYSYAGSATDAITLSTALHVQTTSPNGGTLITGPADYLDIFGQPGSQGAVFQYTFVGDATSTLWPGRLAGESIYVILNGSTASALTTSPATINTRPVTHTNAFDPMTFFPCTVTVSNTPYSPAATPVVVPNVIGMPQASAISAITGSGLNINGTGGAPTITTEYSSTVAAGNVISQNPCANSLAATGASVALVVSNGPAPTQTATITFQGDGYSTWNYFLYSHGYFVNGTTGQITNFDEAFISVIDNLPALSVVGSPPTFVCNAGRCTPCQAIPCAGGSLNGNPVIFETNYVDGTNVITCGAAGCDCSVIGCIQPLNGSGTLTIRDLTTCTLQEGALESNCDFQQGTLGSGFIWVGGPSATWHIGDFANQLVTMAALSLTFTPTESYSSGSGLVTMIANAPAQYLNVTGNVQGVNPLQSPPPATPNPYLSLCYPDEIGICGPNGTPSPFEGTFGLGGPLLNNFSIDWTATLSPTPFAPSPISVTVPNVVGDTQAAATAAIAAARLTVGGVSTASSATVPTGQVISQSPLAGASAASGSAVNLTLSTGPAMVTVPATVGQTQAAATTAIRGATLVLGSVVTQSSMTILPGIVISQSPSAGTSAPSGSAVNLIVSSGSTCADLALVKAAFGSKRGQPKYNPVADVNNDGVVNIIDLSMVARALPAGTVCD